MASTPSASMASSDSAVSLMSNALLHIPTEIKLPRGAKLSDYDLANEEDYEVWGNNRYKTMKGRDTLVAELRAQAEADDRAYEAWLAEARARQADGTLSDMSDLSDLEEDQQPRRKRMRGDAQATAAPLPNEPQGNAAFAINCGLYSVQYAAGITHANPQPGAKLGPLLPLPLHYGQALLNIERDFELPVPMIRQRKQLLALGGPLVSEHIYDLLPKDKRPPDYTRIRTNLFPERHEIKSERIAVCACKRGDPCGDDCINRLMKYLCSPQLCPAGETCTNLPFSMRRGFNEHLRIVHSEGRGFGLQCVKDIPAGEFVMQYVGQVLSRDAAYLRSINEYSGKTNFYMLDYDQGEVIDAGLKGNDARFINHSCAPLLSVERWRLAEYDEFEIGLFANETVPAGTELSYDYGFQAFSSLQSPGQKKLGTETAATEVTDWAKEQRCYCGAASCRGFLSARKASERSRPEPKGRAAAKAANASSSAMAKLETAEALSRL